MTEPRRCCKNCEDRTPSCHCTCEEYKEYKAELEKLKATINKNKESEKIMSGYIRDNFRKRKWDR